jgi:hypothetical protein
MAWPVHYYGAMASYTTKRCTVTVTDTGIGLRVESQNRLGHWLTLSDGFTPGMTWRPILAWLERHPDYRLTVRFSN